LKGGDLYVEEIPLQVAAEFVKQHHYSKVMPKLNKLVLGLFETSGRLVGVITFGWGVRPQHTIKNLFPSLEAKDYLEIGKLCLLDEMPKNSESRFIAAAIKSLKKVRPELKVLFTWADAIWGKPGYIYQASNFLFGGSISSEAYRDENGQRIHPRQLHKFLCFIGEIGRQDKGVYVAPADIEQNPQIAMGNWAPKGTSSGVRRPSPYDLERLKLTHDRGLQFRYIYFLRDANKLLQESPVIWHRDYPKNSDCSWTIKTGKQKPHNWDDRPDPIFTGAFDCLPKNNKLNKNSRLPTKKRKKRELSKGKSVLTG
jgi:hypothetical protein